MPDLIAFVSAWLLLLLLQVVTKELGNHDYTASDHKWLLVKASLGQT